MSKVALICLFLVKSAWFRDWQGLIWIFNSISKLYNQILYGMIYHVTNVHGSSQFMLLQVSYFLLLFWQYVKKDTSKASFWWSTSQYVFSYLVSLKCSWYLIFWRNKNVFSYTLKFPFKIMIINFSKVIKKNILI